MIGFYDTMVHTVLYNENPRYTVVLYFPWYLALVLNDIYVRMWLEKWS